MAKITIEGKQLKQLTRLCKYFKTDKQGVIKFLLSEADYSVIAEKNSKQTTEVEDMNFDTIPRGVKTYATEQR